MRKVDLDTLVLAGEGAIEASRAGVVLSREQLIRRVQSGAVAGGKVLGQWMVSRASLREFIAREIAGSK